MGRLGRGTYTSAYDLAGRRTRLTHPGGFFVQYSHLVTGKLSQLNEWNPSTGGVGYVVATFGYDISGRRTSLTRGNGTVTNYEYDDASRLRTLTEKLAGTAHDQILGFGYNPAGQVTSNTRSNDLFSVTPVTGIHTTPANGLNQVVIVNALPTAHDARGNMTGVALHYDPLGRLVQVTGTPVTRFTHDGANIIAEWDGSNSFQRRYVYAGGELLMQYEGSGISDHRYFHSDCEALSWRRATAARR
jgi:YD repeat-containing protein